MIRADLIEKTIANRFGIDVETSCDIETRGLTIDIFPRDISRLHSFKIGINVGWRTLEAEFVPGNFANGLVHGMESSNITQKAAFNGFAESLAGKGAVIKLNIGDLQVDPMDYSSWPESWGMIALSMQKTGEVFEKSTGYDYQRIIPWIIGFFGLVFSLLPVEERGPATPGQIFNEEGVGQYEGFGIVSTIKSYERNRLNRALCIEIHGSTCKICGFDFADKYGELGEDFIHVHHVVPLSEMQGSYRLNPATDLIPVCPNCHAMLHRRIPALSPEELSVIIRASREE